VRLHRSANVQHTLGTIKELIAEKLVIKEFIVEVITEVRNNDIEIIFYETIFYSSINGSTHNRLAG
jgi:Ser-tRNA(Ala) deacylase AlaX